MSSQIKISIPEPCSEDWNKMIPNESGRFCEHCSKTVIDFTAMPPDEIKHFFLENRRKNICGRIKQSQLDRIVIQIPSRVLYSQTQFHNYFLLALFVVMGTTLFSCADKNGNKQKIDKIEVVEEIETLEVTDEKEEVQQEEIKFTINKPKFRQHIYVAKCSVEEVEKVDSLTTNETVLTGDIIMYYNNYFYFKPDFPGGILKLYSSIKKKFKIPSISQKFNGEMRANFAIEKDGSLTSINILNDLGFGTGEELRRVLLSSPKWYPAEVNGKKVRTKYEIRLTISPEKIKRKFWFNKTISKIDSIQIKPTDWDSIQKAIKELDQKSLIISI